MVMDFRISPCDNEGEEEELREAINTTEQPKTTLPKTSAIVNSKTVTETTHTTKKDTADYIFGKALHLRLHFEGQVAYTNTRAYDKKDYAFLRTMKLSDKQKLFKIIS